MANIKIKNIPNSITGSILFKDKESFMMEISDEHILKSLVGGRGGVAACITSHPMA
jgi:hypothetical protein